MLSLGTAAVASLAGAQPFTVVVWDGDPPPFVFTATNDGDNTVDGTFVFDTDLETVMCLSRTQCKLRAQDLIEIETSFQFNAWFGTPSVASLTSSLGLATALSVNRGDTLIWVDVIDDPPVCPCGGIDEIVTCFSTTGGGAGFAGGPGTATATAPATTGDRRAFVRIPEAPSDSNRLRAESSSRAAGGTTDNCTCFPPAFIMSSGAASSIAIAEYTLSGPTDLLVSVSTDVAIRTPMSFRCPMDGSGSDSSSLDNPGQGTETTPPVPVPDAQSESSSPLDYSVATIGSTTIGFGTATFESTGMTTEFGGPPTSGVCTIPVGPGVVSLGSQGGVADADRLDLVDDDVLDCQDALAFQAQVALATPFAAPTFDDDDREAADLDDDGDIDADDLTIVFALYGFVPGDANMDCVVDRCADRAALDTIVTQGGATLGEAAYIRALDLDDDCDIDADDLTSFDALVPGFELGDGNRDCTIDIEGDLFGLRCIVFNGGAMTGDPAYVTEFDLDADGDLDADDEAALIAILVANGLFLEGDTDDDYIVSVDDFINVLLNFGLPAPNGRLDGDVNLDGTTDVDDYTIVLLAFGEGDPAGRLSCP
ncbi:MAG: hypothetical protein AAGI30_13175 [Planctomycetota bacterium]